MANRKKDALGIRNNNAGNIRINDRIKWDGQVGENKGFVVFSEPEYGIRALAKLLGNYEKLYGLNTVKEIIYKYAPPVENLTNSYVNSVAQKLGVMPDDPINVKESLSVLVPAIIKHENGYQPYSDEQINTGIEWAYA